MSFNSPIYSSFESQEFNKCRIGIIKSSWNNKITDLLYNSAHRFLLDSGVIIEFAFTNVFRTDDFIPKLKPSIFPFLIIATATPTTFPFLLTIGPPLFPGFIIAFV